MTVAHVVRGPLLNPRVDGSVEYFADAALVGDERGRILAVGEWEDILESFGSAARGFRRALGTIIPPMLDAHIHIPQHPIRGGFLEGVEGEPEGGPLLAGLHRNVFPAEARCSQTANAACAIANFREDTLAHGVVGGAAYMTVHVAATRLALEQLAEDWRIGLVLMHRFCPLSLRTAENTLDEDIGSLAADFGSRVIVTDRFAGAVDTPLRRRGVALATRHGLRMQTHLNEQLAEKAWIEALYPEAEGYADVYRRDNLLGRAPILAHCIHMRPEEFDMLTAATMTGAAVAHCPVSNTLLGSGVMSLDEIASRRIPYALCTDVGASPTTSLLCEMLQFLRVHRGRSAIATPQEALFRSTLAPAQILGLADKLGSFDPGKDFSFVEVKTGTSFEETDVDGAILGGLLDSDEDDLRRYEPQGELGTYIDDLEERGLAVDEALGVLTADVKDTAERLDSRVLRVTLSGRIVWTR
jgi:guanine deaminase